MKLWREIEKFRYWLSSAIAICIAVFSDRKSLGVYDLAIRTFSAFVAASLALGGWRTTIILLRTLTRDLKGISILARMKLIIRKHVSNGENIPSLFAKTVAKFGDKVCFFYQDQKWTFVQVDEMSNRIARFFLEHGYSDLPVVGLLMESRPEFICFWLGLSKLGVPVALINSKLRLQSLTHSIMSVDAKCLIYDEAHSAAVDNARHLLPIGFTLLRYDSELPCDFKTDIFKQSPKPVPYEARAKTTFGDILSFIFTSGTTGLPKAAIIRQQRYYVSHFAMRKAFNITPDDVVYCCLPLYHAAGNNVGVGLALMHGCSVVLPKKFSARNFWDDCRKYDVTVIQYIGEICRYLLAQPSKKSDTFHKVRLAVGNGLRPLLWTNFQSRFGIKQIGEFYGSTEGNANMLNIDNHIGAVGFTTPLFRAIHPISIIKMDENNEQVLRHENGLCIHCLPGEEGQLVGRIPEGDRLLQFDGYVNRQASNKRVLKNVWYQGDRAFVSGDIMMMDELGYVYFRDRIGDSFRWKGENVSTAEVEAVIAEVLGRREDVAVFGVLVPGTEGRAGMAVMNVSDSEGAPYQNNFAKGHGKRLTVNQNVFYDALDLDQLLIELKRRLPAYAVPIFLRLLKKPLEITGTFKIIKSDLKSVGFDVTRTDDDVYFLDATADRYVRLNRDDFTRIQEGSLSF